MSMTQPAPLDPVQVDTRTLLAEGLSVSIDGGGRIVREIDLAVAGGEILGIVGESGSGKTTAALALLGFARAGTSITAGSVRVVGEELIGRPEREVRRLRGRHISYVPQDASSGLNPSHRIGYQLREGLKANRPEWRDIDDRCAAILELVHLPSSRDFQRRYIHELSGGQRQRVGIAMGLVCEPDVVVLDEPTTGLDVITQAGLLRELDQLRAATDVAMVYISHDLAVIQKICDRVAVMYGGVIVEEGTAAEVMGQPKHPYSRGLVTSIPDLAVPHIPTGIPGAPLLAGEEFEGCPFFDRCDRDDPDAAANFPAFDEVGPGHRVRCTDWHNTAPVVLNASLSRRSAPEDREPILRLDAVTAVYRSGRERTVACDAISVDVHPGEVLAIVGESGSGKTTLGRCLVGLIAPTSGSVILEGERLAALARDRTREQCRRIQVIFQDPYDSLNPRHTIGESIAFPARLFRGMSRVESRAAMLDLLDLVRLPAALAGRYPRELSGGQRQRVAIARALAAEPTILMCDEITSALDVSVQAAVLELLESLRVELGLTMVFISHDLAVVNAISDRVAVIKNGRLEELGRAEHVIANPSADYTKRLIAAVTSRATR